MILGISHIVRGSTNIDADRTLFESLGWTTEFVERGLPTPAAKRPFMCTASDYQDLVYLRAPVGPALELIHYANDVPADSAPVQMLLPAAAGDAVTLVHFVRDLAGATEFWTRGFGFTSAGPASSNGPVALMMRNPLPQWRLALTLEHRDDGCPEWLVDGSGIRCLSFVSTDRIQDGQTLLGAGAERGTGAMSYTINGQSLEVEMFKAPDGLMVELVAFPGNRP